MRVVHVITTVEMGGAENQLMTLCEYQKKEGISVEIVYLKGRPELKGRIEKLGIILHDLSRFRFGINQISALKKIISPKGTIVHAHLPRAELICAVVKPKNLVITRHNSEAFFPSFPGNLSKILSRFVCSRAKFGIAISHSVHKYLLEYDEIPKLFPIEVIYYGFSDVLHSNIQNDEDLRKELAIDNDVKIVGSVGRLVAQKDYRTTLEAFAIVAKKMPKVVFISIGEGNLQDELRELADSLSIKDKVIWLGRKDNIYQYLHFFDCFILSSIYEGFGLVLLEAASYNLPIVASNVSAVPEVLGKNYPFLCGVGNVEEFSCRLLQILNNPQIRPSLKEVNRDILGRFSPDIMVKSILSNYEKYCR